MTTGARFAKWGLGLFIFGVFLTFGIIAHYCAGSRWPNGVEKIGSTVGTGAAI
jgi:hypothetical protein